MNGVVLVRTPIATTSNRTQNYSVILRLDMESDDTYRNDVLSPNLPITMYVEANGERSYPIESNAGLDVSSTAGDLIRIDLTLGVDSDGDSIPDGWEWTQLSKAGYGPNDPQFNLATIDQSTDSDNDGTSDFDEYLAGTQAFIDSTLIALSLTFVHDDLLEFDLLVREGKRYIVQASNDLINWSVSEVYLPDDPDTTVTTWDSNINGILAIKVPRQETMRFYRVLRE